MIVERRFGADELLARLRRTRLRGFDRAPVYAQATLELARGVDPAGLAPAQRYVLAPTVRTILALRAALLDGGLDVFDLRGGAWVRTGQDRTVPVIPPVVEASTEPDGREVLVVADGMHRVFAARSLGLPITVVLVRDLPPAYPYYALAPREGWSGVVELEELPDGFQKKDYRIPTGYKALFREFDEVFPGVQEQRRATNPAHLAP